MTEDFFDPVYGYILHDKLVPYIDKAREVYNNQSSFVFKDTGEYLMDGHEGFPPGFTVKFSNQEHKSFLNLQMCCFVGVPYLNMPPVPGGVRHLVRSIVKTGFDMGDFMVYERTGMNVTNLNAQFLLMAPKKLLQEARPGAYIYFANEDLQELSVGVCQQWLRNRAMQILPQGYTLEFIHNGEQK